MTWEANYKSMAFQQLTEEFARLQRSQHFYPKYELYERQEMLLAEMKLRNNRED